MPRWLLMWSMAVAIYAACKWFTWSRARVTAPRWRHLAYLFAWPGLDAPAFLIASPTRVARPGVREWTLAIAKTAIGAVILFGLTRRVPPGMPYIAGWVGMIGLAMLMHFGVFHLLSCGWRQAGVDARPLMRAPLASPSLGEFWGRRWNTAFHDLTHRFLFQPLQVRIGARRAVLAGFFASGLVHDLVISVPAGGGYGGPTLFFIVQAAGVLAERTPAARRLGTGRGIPGWCAAMAVVIGPAFLLFHPPFVRAIMVPFLHAIGAR